MTDILAALIQARPGLPLTIELHPRTYDLPIFDKKWLSFFPGLAPASLAAVVRLAALCESRYAQGALPRPEAVETIPWASRDLDWLASSLGYLRSVVPALARLSSSGTGLHPSPRASPQKVSILPTTTTGLLMLQQPFEPVPCDR